MKKILVIEDEVAFLKLITSQLTKQGYSVIQATNGKMGLEKAKSEKPDLILLDIKMPIMDGLTMLSLLRQEESCKKTKVILLTNLEPDEDMTEKVINDQPLYFFIKSDIKLTDLFKKIKTILQ